MEAEEYANVRMRLDTSGEAAILILSVLQALVEGEQVVLTEADKKVLRAASTGFVRIQ